MAVVDFEQRGSVALITLNRPDARNAFSPESMVRLDDAWQRVSGDDSIRAAVVTGTGPVFSAGADLARLVPLMSGDREPEDDYDRAFLADQGLVDRAMLRVNDLDKPVIAAINGHAIAGGMELVQGTDIRVTVPGARFGVQEVRWGLFPMGGSSVRIPAQIPYARAMELLLCGTLIEADEAHALGFVNKVVEPGELLDAAFGYAEVIAANGPIAVRAIKAAVKEALGHPEREAMEIELEHGRPVFDTRDAVEGPRAFLEKRTPKFEGR